MNCYLGATKLQFLEASSLALIEPTVQVEGLRLAGIGDLLGQAGSRDQQGPVPPGLTAGRSRLPEGCPPDSGAATG